MRDYRKLTVWAKSHDLVLEIYKVVLPAFPPTEQYDLSKQVKRSAYSVPLNIVEGAGRNTTKDFAHFLDNALGCCHEVEYSRLLARDLGYLSNEVYKNIDIKINEVKAMLISLLKTIRV